MRVLTTSLFALTIAHAASAEGAGPSGPVSEIVTFRLIEGTSPAAFIDAADDMGPFLRSTDAMVKRTLSVDDTGLWTDHIVWTSLDAAKSAAAAMFERPEAAPFMAMIAPDGMDMRHAAIQLQQE
ncbi:hypothetical protein [uncultured Tateyamaria sp.]|uniref:hypothetical protein n=1 Tax=uncultured Tateyamaria sp. TaxID=455651 RepID=UPI002616BF90|nr:hypothetical protein [uncultured Tateyamaria sp.]